MKQAAYQNAILPPPPEEREKNGFDSGYLFRPARPNGPECGPSHSTPYQQKRNFSAHMSAITPLGISPHPLKSGTPDS